MGQDPRYSKTAMGRTESQLECQTKLSSNIVDWIIAHNWHADLERNYELVSQQATGHRIKWQERPASLASMSKQTPIS